MAGCYGSDVEVELRQMLAGGLGEKSKKLVGPTGVEGGHWAGLLESRPSLKSTLSFTTGQRNLLHSARTLSLEFEEGLCLQNC
jgi:hypothetical protein